VPKEIFLCNLKVKNMMKKVENIYKNVPVIAQSTHQKSLLCQAESGALLQ
jgi:hypothetical protein